MSKLEQLLRGIAYIFEMLHQDDNYASDPDVTMVMKFQYNPYRSLDTAIIETDTGEKFRITVEKI